MPGQLQDEDALPRGLNWTDGDDGAGDTHRDTLVILVVILVVILKMMLLMMMMVDYLRRQPDDSR